MKKVTLQINNLQNFCIKKINAAQFSCPSCESTGQKSQESHFRIGGVLAVVHLCGVSVMKQRLKPVRTECFLWGLFGFSLEKWKILEKREHQA